MEIDWKFWNVWSSYAIYYMGKVNFSIVVPVLLATYGLTKYDIGFVSSGFFFTYAIGQFIHGQISERYNPITYISIGLIGSAIMNAFLGFYGAFFWMLFIGELLDGCFQSMGWSSSVRAMAENTKNRENKSCILGTSYQIGNAIAWIVSAFVVGTFGWQYGFWVASVFMLVRGITLYWQRQSYKIIKKGKENILKTFFGNQIKSTLNMPIIIGGISLSLINMIRYGVIVWIPVYLFEVVNADIWDVGLKVFLIPVFGIIGTLVYNKIKINREVLTCIYLVFLSLVFLIYPNSTGLFSIILLLMSGFFVYGPHVYTVSTLPSRFTDKKIVASSTGFIDGMGYIGTILVGIIVPVIIDKRGWDSVFIFWSMLAIIVIFLIFGIRLLNRKGN